MIGDQVMQSVSPILTSYHIRNTAQFYKEKMGFTITSSMPEMGYLIVSRDSVELHFSLHKSSSPATTMTQCYIRVNNIDVLYAEYEAAGVVHPNGKLEHKPWGMHEFTALDGDGNALRIGQVPHD